MIIHRLTLDNVGPFFGTHSFDLSPRVVHGTAHPIILVGGMNGTGKTTLIDSLRLCLYGAHMNLGQSKTHYDNYLHEQIHIATNVLIHPDAAFIEMAFEVATLGEKRQYVVKRSWSVNGNSRVTENLAVKCDEKALEFEPRAWQEFIDGLLPIGLSRLFIFDAERLEKTINIRKLTELKDSIEALLGTDLLRQLQADLKLIRRRIDSKTTRNEKLADYFESLEKQHTETNVQLQVVENELVAIRISREKQEEVIAKYRQKITAQGGSFYVDRVALSAEVSTLQESLTRQREELRKIAAGLLPLVIASRWARFAADQAREDSERQLAVGVKQEITRMQSSLENILKDESWDELGKINSTTVNKLQQRLRDLLIIFDTPQQTFDLVLDLSRSQASTLISNVEEGLTQTPHRLHDLLREYEVTLQKQRSVQANLERAPEVDFQKEMFDTLERHNRELGELLLQEKLKQEQRAHFLKTLEGIDRELDKLEESTKTRGIDGRVIRYARATDEVLNAFRVQMTRDKVVQLERDFIELFHRLLRKRDFVKRIAIDPETFGVRLFNAENHQIHRLSEGEKQVFAIAMLWSLVRTSGRHYPFIIDTPLARLDSINRMNIIEQFFTGASHQIIIFSTDTEVDRGLFHILRPHLARSYHLEFDDKSRQTTATEGYFWQ